MNHADESVERVLAGLRDTEAPAGIEQRVLRTVQERVAAPVRQGWLFSSARGWVTAGAVAAVLVAVAVISDTRPATVPIQTTMQQVSSRGVTASAPIVAENGPARYQVDRPAVRSHAQAAMRRVAAVRVRQAIQRASRPAPPMPLTPQEKLLLQVARAGDPQEIAMLNPELRAKQEHEAKAEFNRFFEARNNGDNE